MRRSVRKGRAASHSLSGPCVWRLAFGFVILTYIFTFIPFSDVILALSAAKGSYVGPAFAVMVLERFVATLLMQILTNRVGMSLLVIGIWEINTIALFYGMFLPGALAGGAVRWYKLSQPEKSGRKLLLRSPLIDWLTRSHFSSWVWSSGLWKCRRSRTRGTPSYSSSCSSGFFSGSV